MNKKFVKTLLGTTLLVFTLAFTGCGQVKDIVENLEKEKETSVEIDEKVDKNEETTTNEKVEDEKVDNEETNEKDFDLSKSEKAAYNFALAIQSEDYETAFSMLNISDTTFISVDDLSWYIPRTDFDTLVGGEDELTDVSSTGNNTYDTIQLSFGDNVVEVSTILNNDNEWKIDLDGFCLTNWTFNAGKDIPITIGGVEITSDYIDRTEENKVFYTLPSIAARETTIVLSDDYFGTMELKVNPALEDEYSAKFVLTEEQYAPIHEQLKVLLNDANALYETGATATDFAKFFYDENNADQIKLFYDEIEQNPTRIPPPLNVV